MKRAKKLVYFKIFVLITFTLKSIERLGIDSGMLKLIQKNREPFLGDYIVLITPIKNWHLSPYIGQSVDFRQRSLIMYTTDDASHMY